MRRRPWLLAVPGLALVVVIAATALPPLLRPPPGPCTPAAGDWRQYAVAMASVLPEPCAAYPDAEPDQPGFPAVVRFNNFGMSDRDFTLEKPAGTFRLLVLGDSFAQAVQVEWEQNFPWLLEDLLNTDAARPVEVVNLGVAGYGIDRALLLYATLGWQFQPDAVLLAVYAGNDLVDTHIDLEQHRQGFRSDRPYFTLDENGLRLRHSPVFNPAIYPDAPVWRWLMDMQAIQLPPRPENLPAAPAVLSREPYQTAYPVELGLYLPEDSSWAEAWALTEALLLQFRDVVERVDGVPFAVAVIPDRRAVHAADWQITLDEYAADLPALRQADPSVPAVRLERLLEADDIATVNLLWTLRAEADRTGERLYYVGDGHFNAQGHAAAARRLALWLRGRGLAPSAAGG